MSVTYLCQHCRAAINTKSNVVLSAQTKNEKGLILLHEELGNYTSIHSATLNVKEGDVVDIFCPVCHEKLNVPDKDTLAKFIRMDEDLNETFIIISRKYGEKVTFKIDNEKNVETYGGKISRFIDPDWFLE